MTNPIRLAAAGTERRPAMLLPFGVMLLAIALVPFINSHWWEQHFPKVAVGLGTITPTSLTFLAAAMGLHDLSLNNPEHVRQLVAAHEREAVAISLGAVCFGALTYIGNGPNFMVKAITEQAKVKTPGFFAYLLKSALPVLIPIMILVSLLFFPAGGCFDQSDN